MDSDSNTPNDLIYKSDGGFRFYGSVHPKGQGSDYNGLLLTQSEIINKSKELVGLPILFEHDGIDQTTGEIDHTKMLGKIESSFQDPSTGRLMVVGKINRKHSKGADVINKIRRGDISELSLGIDHRLGPDLNVIDKNFKEVSLTSKGALPDTLIYSVCDDRKHINKIKLNLENALRELNLKNKGYKNNSSAISLSGPRIISTMSEAMQTQPTIPQQSSPPVPTQQQQQQQPLPNDKQNQKSMVAEFEEKSNKLAIESDMIEEIEKNPQKAKDFFLRNIMKKRRKLEAMKPALVEWLAANLNTESEKEMEILETIKTVDPQNIHHMEPVFRVISVAASAQKKNVETYEKKLNELRKDLEARENELKRYKRTEFVKGVPDASTNNSTQNQQSNQPATPNQPAQNNQGQRFTSPMFSPTNPGMAKYQPRPTTSELFPNSFQEAIKTKTFKDSALFKAAELFGNPVQQGIEHIVYTAQQRNYASATVPKGSKEVTQVNGMKYYTIHS